MSWIKRNQKWLSLILAVLVGTILWFSPEPEGMAPKAWKLFALFVATILGIILSPFPMGAISVFALTIATITNLLSFSDAFSGFHHQIVWLIVMAFFISRGFILTGLGARLAFLVMRTLGKNSLGLGYGLIATDLILAPTIPSVTARVGGIVFPILKALAEIFTGKSHDPRMGAYLTLTVFQGSAITSAMFLTSMAGNPLVAQLAADHGVTITWSSWAIAAIVPGLLSILIVPYIIYRICTPTIRKTPHARDMAIDKLKEMGPMKWDEWIVFGIFILLIVLWIFGSSFGVNATVAAMIGVSILLLTGILKWNDLLEEHGAWNAFIWFATLITLASFLNQFGFTSWFSDWVVNRVTGFQWIAGFLIVSLIYFYTHYFFASSVAHISAMYAPLLIVAMALGTPPELAALTLAFFSNLMAGLTHYGSGPAPILFGAGYTTVGYWWKIGGIVSAINIFIWLVCGGVWWKIIGLW